MNVLIIGVLMGLILAGGVWIYKDLYVKRWLRNLADKKFAVIRPLVERITMMEMVTTEEIMDFASDPAIRLAVFRVLESARSQHLFPEKFYTQEKGAESFLVNWLEYPTELAAVPDEIGPCEKITMSNSNFVYFVFNFRTTQQGWTRKWMMGVVGPYKPDSLPYEIPQRVYSRFNTVDELSPEKEARWVHEHINRKRHTMISARKF